MKETSFSALMVREMTIEKIIEEVKKWKDEVLEYTKREYREIYPLVKFIYETLDKKSHPSDKLRTCYFIWLIYQKAQERKQSSNPSPPSFFEGEKRGHEDEISFEQDDDFPKSDGR